jgi:hypothetical protein
MAAAEAKLPAAGLLSDTVLAAPGKADEGYGYVGVWATDAAACGTVDQSGATGYTVITTSTFREGDATMFGNFKPMADGKLTVSITDGANRRDVVLEQTSLDALTVDGQALIRCTP